MTLFLGSPCLSRTPHSFDSNHLLLLLNFIQTNLRLNQSTSTALYDFDEHYPELDLLRQSPPSSHLYYPLSLPTIDQMSHLNIYDDSAAQQHQPFPPFQSKPLPSRKPTADFSLFGDDDDLPFALPSHFQSSPWNADDRPSPNSQHREQQLGGAAIQDDQEFSYPHYAATIARSPDSPSLLPDLVPDSPESRDQRARSAPIPQGPRRGSRPVPSGFSVPTNVEASFPEYQQQQQQAQYQSSGSAGGSYQPYYALVSGMLSGAGGGGGSRAPAMTNSVSSSSSASFGGQSIAPSWAPTPPSQQPLPQSNLSHDQQLLLERLNHRPSAAAQQQQPQPSNDMRSAVNYAAQQQLLQFQQQQQHQFQHPQQFQQPQQRLLNPSYAPPLIPMHLSPKQQHLPSTSSADNEIRKTVSPQEAFLDYEDVDSALHSNPRYHSSFGVGVGTGARGASLFAPLPALVPAQYQRHSSPAMSDHSTHSNDGGVRRDQLLPGGAVGSSGGLPPLPLPRHHQPTQQPSSPSLLHQSPPTSTIRASSLPPGSAGPAASASAIKYGHRFAVPRNAVSWEDSHPADEEDDDSSEEVDEETEAVIVKAPRGTLAGKKVTGDAVVGKEESDEDEDEDDDEEEVKTPKMTESVGYGGGGSNKSAGALSGKKVAEMMDTTRDRLSHSPHPHSPLHPPQHAQVALDSNPHQTRHSSPRPATTSSPAVVPPHQTPGLPYLTHTLPSAAPTLAALPPLPTSPPLPKTRPKRQSAVATRRETVELSDDEDEEMTSKREDSGSDDDSDEYVPMALQPNAPGAGGASGSGGRKRSRAPAYAEANSDSDEFSDGDDDASDDAFEDEDSDRPRKNAKSGGAGAGGRRPGGPSQPNKRRRRAPPTSATLPTAANANAIRCTHQYGDGTFCGVIFRRPYDLARHKETIHGEGGKAKKDWVCQECQGSFSRKDALIRHARIRNHEAGV